MSEFDVEEKLKRELRRVDAPNGFADRVMGRVDDQVRDERKRRLTVPRRFAWMAVAAMLLVGIMLGGWERRQRREAEVAHRKFEVAMQVTGRTLVEVQERIGRAGEVHSAGRKQEVE